MDEVFGNWGGIVCYDIDTTSVKYTKTADGADRLLVADVNKDSVLDVIVGDNQFGDCWAFNGVTQATQWTFFKWEHGVSGLAVADLDEDNTNEVYFASGWSSSGEDYMYAVNWWNQTAKWRSQDLRGPLIGPEMGDIDGDGVDDLAIVSWETDSGYDAGRIVVFDSRSLKVKAISQPVINGSAWEGVRDIALRDLDGDNDKDIVIGADDTYDGVVEAYRLNSNMTFTRIFQNTVQLASNTVNCVDAYDIDNDGQMELVGGTAATLSGSTADFLIVYNFATGVEEWRSPQLAARWTDVHDVAVGNVDADAAPEIVAISENSSLHVFDGVSKVKEATIAGNFTALQLVDSTIYAATSAGYIDAYTSTTGNFSQTTHVLLSAGWIDGITVETTSPLKVWYGQAGRLKQFNNNAVQYTSDFYGATYGSRYRNGVTAGRISVNSNYLPAPVMKPEVALNGSYNTNNVGWYPVAQGEEYYVEADLDPNFGSPDFNSGWVTNLAHDFNTLTQGQTYYYRVKTRRNLTPSSESGWSNVVFATQLPVSLSLIEVE
jgi:hypothetical protein